MQNRRLEVRVRDRDCLPVAALEERWRRLRMAKAANRATALAEAQMKKGWEVTVDSLREWA
jgi:hypothetical protein